MNLFRRDYEKLEDKEAKKRERIEGLKKLKDENLGIKDILALIMASFQLIVPFAIGIVAIYFLVILVITKIWMQ